MLTDLLATRNFSHGNADRLREFAPRFAIGLSGPRLAILNARHIVIATGSISMPLPVAGVRAIEERDERAHKS
jgi:hypothetical protein